MCIRDRQNVVGTSGCHQLYDFITTSLLCLKNIYFLLYLVVSGIWIDSLFCTLGLMQFAFTYRYYAHYDWYNCFRPEWSHYSLFSCALNFDSCIAMCALLPDNSTILHAIGPWWTDQLPWNGHSGCYYHLWFGAKSGARFDQSILVRTLFSSDGFSLWVYMCQSSPGMWYSAVNLSVSITSAASVAVIAVLILYQKNFYLLYLGAAFLG